jgi:hypothetical protein
MAVALVAVTMLPPLGRPAPRWVWHFFVAWCVLTPYWHFAEYKLMARRGADPDDWRYQQTLSRAVWAGFAAVFAVWLLASRTGAG